MAAAAVPDRRRTLRAYAASWALATSLLSCARASAPPEPEAPASSRVVARPEPLAREQASGFRLGDAATPLAYDLELELDPRAPEYSGFVRIAVELREPSSAVALNARGLVIRSAHARVGNARLAARASARRGADPRAPHDVLELGFDAQLAGRIVLELGFSGSFQPDLSALYRVEREGAHYVFSQFEPMDARRAFPCFDEPGFKVPVTLTVRAPRGQLAVSNMPEAARKDDGDFTEYRFQTSPPLPSYLLAVAVGPLDIATLEGPLARELRAPLRLVGSAGRASQGALALDLAARELRLLESYFGSRYPYPKLDLVAVPEFESGAMENAGLITFREELLLVSEASPRENVQRMAEILAHELAHMWFGDWVTPKWWDDLWLNEAFATWMELGIVSQLRPDWQVDAAFLGRLAFALESDSMPAARPIREQVRTQSDALRAFNARTYSKGAAILGMVEQWLGPELFRARIARYLAEHAHGVASSADLFRALGDDKHPVQAVMDSFTMQTGVPEITFAARCQAGGSELAVGLSQRAHRPLGGAGGERRWQVPVCVRQVGRSEAECTLLTEPEQELRLPVSACPAPFVPNAGRHGYYHARLEPSILGELAAAAPSALSVREQVGFLMDAKAMLGAGQLDSSEYLSLVERFFAGGPRALPVWEQVLDTLQYLKQEILSPAHHAQLERWVGRLLAPELERVGDRSRPGEEDAVRLLRTRLLTAGGALARDAALIEVARRKAAAWLGAPTLLSGDDAAFALPVAASSNDPELFERLLDFANTTPVSEQRALALRALGSTTAPELVERLLELARSGAVKVQDLRYLIGALTVQAPTRAIVRRWFQAHFAELAPGLPPFILRRTLAAALERCTVTEHAAIAAAFGPSLASLEGAAGLLEESNERAEQCAAFKERHAAALAGHLARLGSDPR